MFYCFLIFSMFRRFSARLFNLMCIFTVYFIILSCIRTYLFRFSSCSIGSSGSIYLQQLQAGTLQCKVIKPSAIHQSLLSSVWRRAGSSSSIRHGSNPDLWPKTVYEKAPITLCPCPPESKPRPLKRWRLKLGLP